jgi:hypothetical protein
MFVLYSTRLSHCPDRFAVFSQDARCYTFIRYAFNGGAFSACFNVERCWSGRTGLPAKQFHPKRVTGVRIPPSPP